MASQTPGLQRPPRAQWLGSPRPATKKLVNPSSLETVLFGPTSSRALPSAARLQRGKLVHWELCRLLLSTYSSLRRKLIEYLKLLPPWHQLQVEAIDSAVHLENLSDFSKECYKFVKNKTSHIMVSSHDQLPAFKMSAETEEDFLVLANSDIAQLCGALIVLWQQFLEVVVHQERIQQHLALEHHQQRVRHFSEAFFIIEKPRNSALMCDDSSYQNYMDVTEALRRSQYLNLLPPVEVECVDLDGDLGSLPIIYEEHYQELARRFSHNSHCSQSMLSMSTLNFLVDDKEKSSNPSLLPDQMDSSKGVDKQQDFQNVFSLPSSPSVLSWSSEPIPSPVTKAQICFPTRKTSCGEKLLTNLKLDLDLNHEEYTICGSSKKGPKMNFRSKVKLKTRTTNLLKQLKRPHFSSSSNSVVLLGFKKLDFGKGFSANNVRPQRASFPLDGGIRHSQSTLSVSSESEVRFPITTSESMPDLTVIIPPPPPPPKARYCASDTNAKATDFLGQSSSIPQSAIYKPPSRQRLETVSSNSLFPPVDKSFHLEKNSSRHSSSPNKYSLAISHKLSSTASADNLKTYTSNLRSREPQNSSAKQSGQITKHVKKTLGRLSGTKKATSTAEGKEETRSISHSHVKMFISLDTLERESNTLETSNQGDPPSPPVEFKDPPGFLDKSKSENDLLDDKEEKLLKPASSTDTLGTSDVTRNKIFSAPRSESFLLNLDTQGTVFFPKPPALFSEGHCSQKQNKSQSQKETVSSSVVKNLKIPVPSPVNNSTTASVRNTSNRQAPPLPQKSVALSSRDDNTPPTLPPKPAKLSSGPPTDMQDSAPKCKDQFGKNGCQQKVGKPESGKTKLSSTHSGRQRQSSTGLSYLETKCTILEMLTDFSETHQCNGVMRKSGIISSKSQTGEVNKGESKTASTNAEEDPPSFRRASVVGMEMIRYVQDLLRSSNLAIYPCVLCSRNLIESRKLRI
ncbi:uncharacterized protein LOC111083133 [Limulus polyphemus]|uniref:Uncharacterized protein LOC111083133 n=1 Tax=Limulus polyphemus TaxID=6850 RepID=A0ABM1RUR3_LIMPO|nr:uncharacterized protein LOC111083133 [Limulus polyphemus]